LTLVNYGLRFFKWHYLLGRINVHVPVRTNVWVFTSGLAMVISPAKAGELVKPYLIRVLENVPMTKTVPVLISERSWNSLNEEQQAALAAAGQKAEEYFAKEAAGLDQKMIDVFKENGVEVVNMSPENYQAWLDIAKKSSYKTFAENVPNGQALIDAALAVE